MEAPEANRGRADREFPARQAEDMGRPAAAHVHLSALAVELGLGVRTGDHPAGSDP